MTEQDEHRPAAAAPLAKLRVIAVEQYGAGPYGTMLLADLGAEIIKIEDPSTGGDISRSIPPVEGTDSLYFEAFNRNKRSLALDLKSAAGREVFERLVATADAVFSNLRGDQPERLGITYEQLREVNPAIVCVALTGYGRGPGDAHRSGYDPLVQAEAGWAALTGGPDDPPIKSGLSIADYGGGIAAMVGLLAAVLNARETGVGRDVDTNLYDGALSMLNYPATWHLSAGIETGRKAGSAHPRVVPFQFFETADGYLAVAALKDGSFGVLVTAMELPELAEDPRFTDVGGRAAHRTELVPLLATRFAEQTTAEWIERLPDSFPAAPVRSMGEALDLDELSRRSMLVEYEHPTLGRVRSVGPSITMTDHEPVHRPGPSLGGDAPALLDDLGYDAGDVDRLTREGAFGVDSG